MSGRSDLVASAAYQPEPAAAAAARRFVRQTLQSWDIAVRAWDPDRVVDDAVLLTSELVTNAVVHAGTALDVTCRLVSGELEVAVRDRHPARTLPDIPKAASTSAERGRGLLLPSALATSWGVTYARTAKAVWFRMSLARDEAGDEMGDLPPAIAAAAGADGTWAAGAGDAAVAGTGGIRSAGRGRGPRGQRRPGQTATTADAAPLTRVPAGPVPAGQRAERPGGPAATAARSVPRTIPRRPCGRISAP